MFALNSSSWLLPRNIFTTIGLPLAVGLYSGSYTGTVVRGNWYKVCSVYLRIPVCFDKIGIMIPLEPVFPSWTSSECNISVRMDQPVCSDGVRIPHRYMCV